MTKTQPVEVSALHQTELRRPKFLHANRWRIALAALAAFLIYVPVPAVDPDTSGLPLMATRVRDLGLFFLITVVLILVGLELMARLRAKRKVAALELAAAYVVGQGVLGAGLLGLGLGGFFSANVLQIVLIGTCALAPSERAVERLRNRWLAMRSTLEEIANNGPGRFLVIGVGVVLLTMLVISLGPLVTWDGPMYHLDLPAEFLEVGRIFLPDDNLHVAYIAAPQMVLSIPLSVGTTAYLAFSQVVSFVLTICLVAGAVSAWASTHAARLAIVMVFAATGLVYASDYDKVDMSFVVATLVALLWVVASERDSEAPNLAFLGLIVGAALLTKYQAIPFLVGVAVVLAWHAVSRRVEFSPADAIGGLSLAVLLFSPFLLKNAVLLGHPLYPFLTARMAYPWLGTMGLELPDGLHSGFATLQILREPFNIVDYLFSPASLTVERQGVWFGFPLIYLVGLGALLTRHRRLAIELLVFAAAGLGLILLVTQTINLRYFLPLFPVFSVLTAIVLAEALPDGSTTLRRCLILLVAVAGLVAPLTLMAEAVAYGGRFQVGAGLASESEWLDRGALESNRSVRELGAYLATDEFGHSARAMLFFEARGFHLGSGVIQDNGQNNWLLLNEALGDRCPDPGLVSHVIVNGESIRHFHAKGLSPEDLKSDEFDDFASRCLDPVDEVAGYVVYRVDG